MCFWGGDARVIEVGGIADVSEVVALASSRRNDYSVALFYSNEVPDYLPILPRQTFVI
jgi:hypothetical protein